MKDLKFHDFLRNPDGHASCSITRDINYKSLHSLTQAAFAS